LQTPRALHKNDTFVSVESKLTILCDERFPS